jgi:LuxR family maltose regulon positive regulatory protein
MQKAAPLPPPRLVHSARTVTRYARALLAAKLNPPAPGSAQVPREAVWEQVGQAANARVVLVRAPAGFGKTTALLQSRERLQARGVSVGWLTLDAADNDPSRFLTCLAQAIDEMTGHGAAGGRGDDDSSHADPPSALAVVENLASQAHPFALVLDDFECIQEPAVLGLVRQIIDHLPRGGQLLIGSRSLPSLSLGRLRARGQLLEIDTDSLRFSLAETIEFLSGRRNLLLPLDDLSRLHRKTEAGSLPCGWPRWRSRTARVANSSPASAPTRAWLTTC